jgi:hypothetical protein
MLLLLSSKARLQVQYPQLKVEYQAGREQELLTQLQWLSRTSIVVTNIGSSSFRMIYVPDGAQVRPAIRIMACACVGQGLSL